MDDEENPYASPEHDESVHQNKEFAKEKTVLPGKLVALFGAFTLLIPAVIIEDTEEFIVNAIMYGIPAGIAALIFGLKNITDGRKSLGDVIGVAITLMSFGFGIYMLVA